MLVGWGWGILFVLQGSFITRLQMGINSSPPLDSCLSGLPLRPIVWSPSFTDFLHQFSWPTETQQPDLGGQAVPNIVSFYSTGSQKITQSCGQPVSGIHSLAAPAVAFVCRVRDNEVENMANVIFPRVLIGILTGFGRTALVVEETLSFQRD